MGVIVVFLVMVLGALVLGRKRNMLRLVVYKLKRLIVCNNGLARVFLEIFKYRLGYPTGGGLLECPAIQVIARRQEIRHIEHAVYDRCRQRQRFVDTTTGKCCSHKA